MVATPWIFQQRLSEYRAGPTAGAWKNLCEQFYRLNPGDSFGPCHCGGELFWTKRAHSWLAICDRCNRATCAIAIFSGLDPSTHQQK